MRNRFMTWLYIGSAGDWAVVLFVLSAAVSCAKSLWELLVSTNRIECISRAECIQPLPWVNALIIILFIVSMGLAFMIDSVQNPSFPKRGKGRF